MSANVHSTVQTEKKRPWLRFGLAFTTIFLVVLIVFALTTPLLNPLRKRLAPAVAFPVAEGAFAADGSRLFCAGETALWVYSPDSSAAEYPADFSVPRFRSAGTQLLTFDAAGPSLARLTAASEPIVLDAGGTFFDAAVAENGAYALLLDRPDCRAELEVYDRSGNLRFRHRSRSVFLNTCALSPDAALVAVTTVGQRELVLAASLRLYRTDRDDEPLTWPLDAAATACGFLSEETLYVSTLNGLSLYRTDGTLLQSLPGARLLASDGSALLAFSGDTLQLFRSDGALQAVASLDSEPISAALCGDFLALQLKDSLRVYTRDFTLRGQADAAGTFCLCANGALWRISDQTATQLIP